MLKSKRIRIFLFSVLFGVLICVMGGGQIALAALEDTKSQATPLSQEEASAEGNLELFTSYPVVSDISGKTFKYEVELRYEGAESRTFDLSVTQLPGWIISILPAAKRIEITQIRLQPGKKPPESVRITLEPVRGEVPEPGEYVVELKADSDGIGASIELKAVVTDLHEFSLTTESGRLNTDVAAGKDNQLKALITNTGTVTIPKIAIVAAQPEQWLVKFEPSMVENLAPGSSREVDIEITPPRETIAGDYVVTITAGSVRYNTTFKLRTTVLVSAIWRVIGILIVIATLAAVALMYQRLVKR